MAVSMEVIGGNMDDKIQQGGVKLKARKVRVGSEMK